MLTHYDPLLVGMSFAIAVLASYVALDLAERVTSSSGRARVFWWLGGAVAMGVGIWSMHFVGMLALQLSVPVEYHVGLVLLSVVIAIAAAGMALHVVSRSDLSPRIFTVSSVLMGGAISGMHYVGMAAMVVPLTITWRPPLVVASILIAIVASFAGLMSAFTLRRPESRGFLWVKLGAAIVMGLAIVGMHYTGMAAAQFGPAAMPHGLAGLSVHAQGLEIAVIAATLLILGLALAGNQVGQVIERKRLEAELRNSERRHRYIFQAAGVSILELDFSRVQGALDDLKAVGVTNIAQYLAEHPAFVEQAFSRVTTRDVNDATLKLLAAENRDDAIRSLPHVFLPETRQAFVGGLIALADGQMRFESETVLQNLKGDRLSVLFTIVFPPQPAALDNVLVSVMDVTERKRAEDALRQTQSELARITRIVTIGELAASIAHEVNQPLSGVVINGKACLRWLAAASPNIDEAREAVQGMIRDGERACDVIARIRTLSTKRSADKAPFDMNEAIREVVALTQGEIRRQSILLRTVLAGDLPYIRGDRVQLQQVLLNLTMNGIEAMSAVRDRLRELVIRTERADGVQVQVSVQDSGPGLDQQTMDRVFEAFYTTKPSGMGLGLSISRSIIENHGGRLWVVRGESRGATFQFTI